MIQLEDSQKTQKNENEKKKWKRKNTKKKDDPPKKRFLKRYSFKRRRRKNIGETRFEYKRDVKHKKIKNIFENREFF